MRHEPGFQDLSTSAEAAVYAAALAGPTRMGLGCMALTGVYGHVPRRQAVATVKAALSVGVRLFDTAPLYGDGANEELLGELVAKERNVCIVTKFGLYSGTNGKTFRNSNPSAVRRSVDCSLRRLRRDRIELLLQHRADVRIPDADVAGVIGELISEGKVRAFGLSSTTVKRTAQVDRNVPVRAVQNEWSLLKRSRGVSEPRNFGAVGSAYIAYSPLGKGALTSAFPRAILAKDDFRSQMDNFNGSKASFLSPLLEEIVRCAERHHIQPASVCLAWVVGSGENVVAIPGARSPEQITAALAADKTCLSVNELEALEKWSSTTVLGPSA